VLVKDGNQLVRRHKLACPEFKRCNIKGFIA
jgi:hypothetical protein